MVGISINLSKGHKNKSESANLASVKIDQCYEAKSWYTSINFYFSQSLFEMNKMHHIFFFEFFFLRSEEANKNQTSIGFRPRQCEYISIQCDLNLKDRDFTLNKIII